MNKMYSEQDAIKTLENLRKRKSDERSLSMIKAKGTITKSNEKDDCLWGILRFSGELA